MSLDFGSPTTRRMPIYILIGCGDSMIGTPILAVEQGVQLLQNELMNQPQAVEMVHMSVICYSTYVDQKVPLTSIMEFKPPELTAGGSYNLGEALQVLGHYIKQDLVRISDIQKGDYKALVVLITDHDPTDDWQAGLTSLKKSAGELLGSILVLAIGDEIDITMMKQITPNVLSMTDISPANIRSFFRWDSQKVLHLS
jgi:uncharacterized protein YegL